jgi:hypothetical protein
MLSNTPTLTTANPVASDFKFVFDRSDDGEASIALMQKETTTDAQGHTVVGH